MTEDPVANDNKKTHQSNQPGAGSSRDGSFKPDMPAVESFNLYLKDENSGLISLVNRDSNLTEQEIAQRQRESISLSELVQRQENGDLIAKSFVSAFQDALKMTRGVVRDNELRRLQEVADETFRRGKHAPDCVYQNFEYKETLTASSSSIFSGTDNETLFPGEKLTKLFDYADSQDVSESERQTLLRSELTKIISGQTIQADAIENIRANGGIAWFALNSLINGTVINLLAEPGARHSPLFHTLVKTLDAIHRDPQAVSKALSILGNQIDISQK
jgi:hypothetical protein